jgi:hypothetical protein
VVSDSELHFRITRRDEISITDIQTAMREAWRQIGKPGTTEYANYRANRLDRFELPGKLGRLVAVRPDGAGIAGVDVIIVLSGKVAWDLWKHVLLPHLRDRWGDDALKRKRTALPRAKSGAASIKRNSRSRKPARRK